MRRAPFVFLEKQTTNLGAPRFEFFRSLGAPVPALSLPKAPSHSGTWEYGICGLQRISPLDVTTCGGAALKQHHPGAREDGPR